MSKAALIACSLAALFGPSSSAQDAPAAKAAGDATVTFTLAPESSTLHGEADAIRHHLLLGLTEEMNDRIEKLGIAQGHIDKAEVINRAVGLFNFAIDSARQGKRIWIVNADGELDTEIDGLLQ